jgi:hypothetical protein
MLHSEAQFKIIEVSHSFLNANCYFSSDKVFHSLYCGKLSPVFCRNTLMFSVAGNIHGLSDGRISQFLWGKVPQSSSKATVTSPPSYRLILGQDFVADLCSFFSWYVYHLINSAINNICGWLSDIKSHSNRHLAGIFYYADDIQLAWRIARYLCPVAPGCGFSKTCPAMEDILPYSFLFASS